MKCTFVVVAGMVLFLLAPRPAAGQTLLTETTWGAAGAEFPGDVATAADGSAYVVGSTDSFAVDQFGQPAPRLFVVKFAADGSVAWQRIWNGPTGHSRPAVSVGTDNSVFMAGFTTNNGGDAVVLKFDADGALLWERTWGGSENDSANAVAAAADGSVYVTGRTTSFGPSDGMFVANFDGDGNLVWQKISNGAGGDAIALTPDGSVYTASSLLRGDDFANFDLLVLKLTAAGSEIWRRTYSAGEVVDARGRMAAAPDGSIVLAGAIQAEKRGIVGIDPLIVKLDREGNLIFQRVLGAGDTAEGVSVADDGSIYVTGTTTSAGKGFQDAFLLHLEPDGKKGLDAATWGGAGFEEGRGVAAANGTVVLAAYTTTAGPYSLLESAAKLSTPKGRIAAAAGATADVDGTVGIVGFGAATPNGSTTYAGNFEAALVRVLR
jgi:hypothetical protein